jgi:hypothetical protein
MAEYNQAENKIDHSLFEEGGKPARSFLPLPLFRVPSDLAVAGRWCLKVADGFNGGSLLV